MVNMHVFRPNKSIYSPLVRNSLYRLQVKQLLYQFHTVPMCNMQYYHPVFMCVHKCEQIVSLMQITLNKSIVFHGTNKITFVTCVRPKPWRFHLKAISSKAFEMQSQPNPACSDILDSVEVKALHFVHLEDTILIWVGVKVNSTVMLQIWTRGLLSQRFQQVR